MNKKLVLMLILVALVIASGVAMLFSCDEQPSSENNLTQNSESSGEISNPAYTEDEEPTKNDENINGLDKPIFMYFVTNQDLENPNTKETLERLQAEYKDSVIFEIRNADEDKSLYDNFPIDGTMPMLIMQKKGGDISNILFKTNDYQSLKAAIDATL